MGWKQSGIRMTTSIQMDQHESWVLGEATRGVDPWIAMACRRLRVGSSGRAESLSALFASYTLQDLDKASGRSGRRRCPSSDSRTVVLVFSCPVGMRDQRYSTSG
jgi:hypothetical protein